MRVQNFGQRVDLIPVTKEAQLKAKLRAGLAEKPVETTRLAVSAAAPQTEPGISTRYHDGQSKARRTGHTITRIITAPLRFIAAALGFASRMIFDGLAHVLQHMLPRSWSRPIGAVLGALQGIVDGVLRMPQALVSGVVNTVRAFCSIKRGRDAVAATLQLLLTPLTTLVMPLYHGFKTMDDKLHPPKMLTEEEKQSLAADFPRDVLDGVRIHSEESLVFRAFGAMAAAQTLGDDVYGDFSAFDTHELVHVLQYKDAVEEAPFLSEYFANYGANLIAMRDLMLAYEDIPFEVEAYHLE